MAYSNTRYTNQYGPAPPPGHSRPRNNMPPPPRPQQRGASRGNTWTRDGAAGVTHGRYPTHAQPAFEQNQDNGVGRANFQQQGGGSIVCAAEAIVQNGPAFEYVFNPESDYADVYENPALRDAAAGNIAPPATGWTQAQPFVYQSAGSVASIAEVQKPAESSLADFEAIVRKASKQVADGTAPNYYPGVIQLPKPDPTAQAISSAAKGDWSNVSQQLKVYNEQQPMQQVPASVSQPIVEQVPATIAQPVVSAVPGDPQPIGLYFPPPRQADVLPELYGPMLAIWLKQESIKHWDEVDRIRIGFTPSLVPQTVNQVVAAMQVCVDRVVEEERIRRELEDQEILRVLTETLRKENELEAEAQEKLRAELDECKADGEGTLETESDEKEDGEEIVEEKESVEVKAVEQDVHEKAADENELDGESVVMDGGVEEELFGIEMEEQDVGQLEMEANATAEVLAVPQVAAAQMMASEKPLSKKKIAEREQAAFQQDADRIKLPASTVSSQSTMSLAEALEKRKSMDDTVNPFKKQKIAAGPTMRRPVRKPASPLFASGSTQASRNAQRFKNNAKVNDGLAKIVTSVVNQHSLSFVDPAQEANDEFAEMTAGIAAARDAEAKRKMEAEPALGPVETPEAAAQRTHARCGLALPPMKCAAKTNTVRSDETQTMWRDAVQKVGESVVSSPAQSTSDSGSSGTETSQQSTPPSSPAGDSDEQSSKPSGGSTTTRYDGNGKSAVKNKMSLSQYTKKKRQDSAASPAMPYPAAAHAGSSTLTTAPATAEKRKRGDGDEGEGESDGDAKKPKLDEKGAIGSMEPKDAPPPQVFTTNERLGKGKAARAAGTARFSAEQARQAEKRKRDDGGEDGKVKKSKKTKTADTTVNDTSRVPYLSIAAVAARDKDDTKPTAAGKRKHDGEDGSDEPVKKTKLEDHHAFFSAPSNEAPALNEDGLAPQNEGDGSTDEVFTAANEDENEHVEKDGEEDEAGDASEAEETGDMEESDEVEVNDEVDENFGKDNEGHVVLMPFDVEKDLTGLLQYNNAKPEEDDDDDDEPFTEAPPSPPRGPAHETVASAAAKRQFAGNPALAKLARQKARLNQQ
ncbi:hypothetical protein LTR97_003427 [Elasticomyces elasticus]|uniref:Uncharacterized protein n=1 Tax=Elasticomyces elasticus TaxID=574655 RepID=A0AAN7WGS0_9PEZI|nr:hypothetical protein LTR97_003427 [Elasticomyces elasticus]